MNASAAPARVSVRRFRENLAMVLRRVAADGEYVIVTRRGAPAAAVVPLGVLDLLDATEGLLMRRTLVAAGDLRDVATAARDVPPRVGPATDPESRPHPTVRRRG